MHVLHVTPYFPPTWAYGGIPRIVWGLGRALVDRGHRVTVLTTDAFDERRRAAVPPERLEEGVRVLTCPNLSNRLAYRHQLFLPRGVAGRLAAAGIPDAVHLHGHRHLLNTAVARWARTRGIPYVLTANGTLPRHERKQALKVAWDLLFAAGIPEGAARCIVVSRAEHRQHVSAGLPPERLVLIPNGLDLGEFDPLPPRGGMRSRLGLGPDVPLVVYLGQVSPRKGVDHLVEAFAHDPPGGAVLAVAGNDMGGMAAARARLAAGSPVHFLGLLEGRDRISLLVDADVLVYASSDEVFGLVPFEGLLSGTPVVVGDDCGCGELIQEAGAGLTVRHGDVAELRRGIARLLTDPLAAQAMVARGRACVRARYAWDRVAALHEEVYADVARCPRETAA